MYVLIDLITRYWHSLLLIGIVGIAIWQVYKKWYKLKV